MKIRTMRLNYFVFFLIRDAGAGNGLILGNFTSTLLDILLGGHQLPRALARGLGLPLLIRALAQALIFKLGLKPKSERALRPQAEARGY